MSRCSLDPQGVGVQRERVGAGVGQQARKCGGQVDSAMASACGRSISTPRMPGLAWGSNLVSAGDRRITPTSRPWRVGSRLGIASLQPRQNFVRLRVADTLEDLERRLPTGSRASLVTLPMVQHAQQVQRPGFAA